MVTKMIVDSTERESLILVRKLCCIWGLIVGSFSVLQVSTPLILKDILGRERAPTWQGIFTATTALSGTLCCGLVGHYSDRIGRLELITPWVVAFFISTLLVIYADAYHLLYPLWIARLTALSIPSTVIHAFFSDYLNGNALLKSYSYMGATFGISMLSSSFLCGLIGWYYSRIISLVFGVCLSGLAVIFTLNTRVPSALRCSSPRDARTGGSEEEEQIYRMTGLKKSLGIIYEDKLLRYLMFALALLRVGNVSTQMMLVLFLNFRFGWGLLEVGVLTGVTGFIAVMFQLGVRFVISSNNVLLVFVISLTMVPMVVMGYGMAMTGFQVYIVSFLAASTSVGSTIFNAKVAALATEMGISGLTLGCVGTLHNFLEILSSLLLGRLLSWSFASYPPTSIMSGLPFLVNGALLTLVPFIVVYSHRRYGAGRITWGGGL